MRSQLPLHTPLLPQFARLGGSASASSRRGLLLWSKMSSSSKSLETVTATAATPAPRPATYKLLIGADELPADQRRTLVEVEQSERLWQWLDKQRTVLGLRVPKERPNPAGGEKLKVEACGFAYYPERQTAGAPASKAVSKMVRVTDLTIDTKAFEVPVLRAWFAVAAGRGPMVLDIVHEYK